MLPFDGSGTFSRNNGTHTGTQVWQDDAAADLDIEATLHDTHDQDIANALSNCITRDGQSTISANIPFNSKRITGLAAGTARTDAATVEQIQDSEVVYAGTTAGSGDAFTATLSPAITAYATGMYVLLKANRTNTGASTLNLNGVSATAIRKYNGTTALVANDILSGQSYLLQHDGTFWILLNPSYPSFYGANLQGLTASRPLDLDASKNLQSPTATDFKTTHSIASSGNNADITGLTGLTIDTWSPTVTASGSMTVSSLSVNQAQYKRYGPFIHFHVSCTFTLGGTASTQINVSVGLAGVTHNVNCAFACSADENIAGTATAVNNARWRYDGTNLIVFKPGGVNWSLGANAAININGHYRI